MFDKNKFKACIVASGKSMSEVANYLGINKATLFRKIRNNGSFTRIEMLMLIEFLQIDNPMDVFFAA